MRNMEKLERKHIKATRRSESVPIPHSQRKKSVTGDLTEINVKASRRTSPRKAAVTQKQIVNKQIETGSSKPSSKPDTFPISSTSLAKFRIPKKKADDEDASKVTSVPLKSEKVGGRIMINDGKGSNNIKKLNNDESTFKKEASQTKTSDESLVRKGGIESTKLMSINKGKKPNNNRGPPLKARRRNVDYKSQVQNVNKDDRKKDEKCKLDEPPVKTQLLDLPDYEEVGPEDMEWENPISQILKIVKENEDSTTGVASTLNQLPSPKGSKDFIIDPEVMEIEVDTDPLEQLIIVTDTNIWIHDLDFVKALLKQEFPRVSSTTIVIPWMVLQELDVGLHKQIRDREKIRKPINFIYSLLSSGHPRIKGQKASEAAVSKLKFNEVVADDSILNCVFQCQASNNFVVFLSNDKNLLNKALVQGILTANSKTAMNKIYAALGSKLDSSKITEPISDKQITTEPCFSVTSASFCPSTSLPMKRKFGSKLQKPSIKGTSASINNGEYSVPDNYDIEMQDESFTADTPPIVKIRATGQPFSSAKPRSSQIFDSLLSAFSFMIRRRMVEDYGIGGWEYALKIKPPWNLSTAIKCMLVHWIANFQFIFTNKGLPHLEALQNLVEAKRAGHSDDQAVLEQIVETSLALFNFLDPELDNEPEVKQCRTVLLNGSVSSSVR